MTSMDPYASLQNRQIIVGLTGGIAAYKGAELVRLLRKAGAEVRVVMTRAATEFITPLSLQALSGKPVHLDLLDTEAEAGMGHIELARWADAVVVAPASADFIARLVQGRGDDLLTTVCLATPSPIAVAPAMNQQMWQNAATRENCRTLQSRGITLFGPAEGEQACGDTGPGRLLEAADLCRLTAGLFDTGILAGKRVVITAGPTREALDPVRYLSNHSSGKMGYALAQAAVDAGAIVRLITGPTALPAPGRLTCVPVTSALEMHREALSAARDCDLFIAAAAVADYRPAKASDQKIKKGDSDSLTLDLVKNPDIVADVARQFPNVFVVGFAAETGQLLEHAKDKLQRKGLDMLIANDVSDPAIGFNSDQNAVTVLTAHHQQSLPIQPKRQLARQLLAVMADSLNSSSVLESLYVAKK